MIYRNVTTIALAGMLCLCGSLFPPTSTAAASQNTFYVSPTGNDKNPGTKSEPFATVERARDEVRKVNKKMSGDIEVILHSGIYQISETLVFDHRDGGTGGHNVVYKAAEGETPVISGGRAITGWKADADGRWKAACGEHFRQLYVNGKRAVRARSPETKAKSIKWFDLGIATVPGMKLFGENGYRTTDAAMADWRNPGDIEFCYYVGWSHTRCKVESIVRDGPHAIVRMVQPQFMLARRKEGVRVKLPNYVENALELLDEPGEWYLDRSDKVLYYMPLPGEKMDEVKVVAPVLEKIVELRGLLDKPVEHIQFHGITFAYATWLRPSRIGLADLQANFVMSMLNRIDRMGTITNVHNEVLKSPANIVCRTGRHIRFERCTFAHLGGAGLDLEYGSSDNVVEGCRFHDISGTAIQVGGIERDDHHPGDERTTVRNNQVHLYDTPSAAKNNRIEANHVHHVQQKLSDGGGIYTLGNMPGTIIRGNHIHNNGGHPGAIYLDEGSGLIEVTGNLVYNVAKPLKYNHPIQNRLCKEHGNRFGNEYAKGAEKLPEGAKKVIDEAGLQPEYRELLKK
jgi:hypothetical protein